MSTGPSALPLASEAEKSTERSTMKVWIDQDLCTGDGLCEEIAPDVFFGMDDGLFYVKESKDNFGAEKLFDGSANPAGAEGMARIPDGGLERVIESAEECPGECIFIDVGEA
jgi:ferredoxin